MVLWFVVLWPIHISEHAAHLPVKSRPSLPAWHSLSSRLHDNAITEDSCHDSTAMAYRSAMETLLGRKQVSANLVERTKSLVSLILLRLDEAISCIEQIHAAFQSEDIHLTSRVLEHLQRAMSHAYVAILTLEQHTGCRQVNARSALAYCRHLTRMPQSLAWCLISQLPSTHRLGSEQTMPEPLTELDTYDLAGPKKLATRRVGHQQLRRSQ
jgi:hypothetical protein